MIWIFIWIFVRIKILIRKYSDIRSCQKIHTNIFGYSFGSFSWHEYIRIFVRVKIDTNVTLWCRVLNGADQVPDTGEKVLDYQIMISVDTRMHYCTHICINFTLLKSWKSLWGLTPLQRLRWLIRRCILYSCKLATSAWKTFRNLLTRSNVVLKTTIGSAKTIFVKISFLLMLDWSGWLQLRKNWLCCQKRAKTPK